MPFLTCGMIDTSVSKVASTCPPIKSFWACALLWWLVRRDAFERLRLLVWALVAAVVLWLTSKWHGMSEPATALLAATATGQPATQPEPQPVDIQADFGELDRSAGRGLYRGPEQRPHGVVDDLGDGVVDAYTAGGGFPDDLSVKVPFF